MDGYASDKLEGRQMFKEWPKMQRSLYNGVGKNSRASFNKMQGNSYAMDYVPRRFWHLFRKKFGGRDSKEKTNDEVNDVIEKKMGKLDSIKK